MGTEEDYEVLETFGRHEEFTLYAAVALLNLAPDAPRRLRAMAEAVHGWGRIALVERLAEEDPDPETRRWLLYEGFYNLVDERYSALLCARAGGLSEALDEAQPDDRVVDAAPDLLAALAQAGEFHAYEPATRALARWLELAATRPPKIRWGPALIVLGQWLESEKSPSLGRLQDLLARPEWTDVVEAALQSDDRMAYEAASKLAPHLGIDAWPVHFERMQREDHIVFWQNACRTEDPERITALVAHAEKVLPLGEIGSGPEGVLGIGPEYEPHHKLDLVLPLLKRHPGLGEPLLRAAHMSPIESQRRRAALVAAAWAEAEG